MKHVKIGANQIADLVNLLVETKDKDFDMKKACANMREIVWKTMLRPLESNTAAGVDFLYSFVKIKDAVIDMLKACAMNDLPTNGMVQLEDAEFELLYNSFMGFNNWNPELAHVILLASDALKAAKEAKV